jgi:heme/copper-type cytochrome/quinol oxidase subunit 2
MADAPNKTLRLVGGIVLVVVLFAMLVAAGWHAMTAWSGVNGAPMPTTGYVAMTLGIVFSLVVGCGLMALLFYSSRHGYDEPHYDQPRFDEPHRSEPDND